MPLRAFLSACRGLALGMELAVPESGGVWEQLGVMCWPLHVAQMCWKLQAPEKAHFPRFHDQADALEGGVGKYPGW